MFDRRLKLSQEVAKEARSHFGSKVFETVVPRNVRLGEAPSHGQPVILYDILSPGAISYLKLAGELIEREPFAERKSLPPAVVGKIGE